MFNKLCSLTLALAVCLFLNTGVSAQLLVDFDSNQDNGPHTMAGYESYFAKHEVAADFNTKTYSATFFGGAASVTVTPAWPNTADNRVMQSIDRSTNNHDANWKGNDIDLITDFIGIDTRTGNGGNGNWDGTTGTPTYLTLTLGGLPAGDYQWLSLHHDTENTWPRFQVEVSTDGGTTYGAPTVIQATNSSTGGNPANPVQHTGDVDPDPRNLPSTFITTFTADGTADVVIRYAPYAEIQVHKQIMGVNGFELTEAPAAEVCDDGEDNDGDGDVDCADADCAEDVSCPKVDQIAGDADQDGDLDITDIILGVQLLFPGFSLLNRDMPLPPCGANDAGNVAVLDVNGDGGLSTSDLVSAAMYLFGGGPPPAQGEGCFEILADLGCPENAGCE